MKQEEAAKDNALAEASAMTKTEAANLAWAKDGQKKGHLRCAKESFGYVWCFFIFVDVHMANMDALFFRGLLLFCFLCIFCICCSWLPGP